MHRKTWNGSSSLFGWAHFFRPLCEHRRALGGAFDLGSLGRVKVAGLVLGMLSSRPRSSPASPPLGQRARASKAFSPLLTSRSDGAGPDKAHRQLWTSIRVGEATVRGVKGGWSWTCPASRRGTWGGSGPWTSPLPGANSQRSVQLPAAAVTLAKMDRLIISTSHPHQNCVLLKVILPSVQEKPGRLLLFSWTIQPLLWTAASNYLT